MGSVVRASTVARLVRAAREAAEVRTQTEVPLGPEQDGEQENEDLKGSARERAHERVELKRKLLEQVYFIRRLPIRLRTKLAEAADVAIVPEGTALLEQGDALRQLIVLCSGQTLLSLRGNSDDRHSQEKIIRADQAPACYGGRVVITGEEEQVETVRIVEGDALCLFLDGEQFDSVLGNSINPNLVLELRREAREVSILSKIPLLRGLNPMQHVQVLHVMRTITFEPGEIICTRGEREEVFFALIRGSALAKHETLEPLQEEYEEKEQLNGKDTGEVSNNEPASGRSSPERTFWGELALLQDRRSDETIIAKTQVTCLYMHRLAFLEHVPHLRHILLEQASQLCTNIAKQEITLNTVPPEHSEAQKTEQAHCFSLDLLNCRLYATSIDLSVSPEGNEIAINKTHNDTPKAKRTTFESAYEAFALRDFAVPPPQIVRERQIVPLEVSTFDQGMNDEDIHERPNDIYAKTREYVASRPPTPVAIQRLKQDILHETPGSVSEVVLRLKERQRLAQKLRKKNKKKGGKQDQTSGKVQPIFSAAGEDTRAVLLTSRIAKHIHGILNSPAHERSDEDLQVLHSLFARNPILKRLALGAGSRREKSLFKYAELAQFEAGQSLWREGEPIAGLHLILRGQVHVSVPERFGPIFRRFAVSSSRSMGTIGAGGALGELSLLDPEGKVYKQAVYNALAMSDTDVLFIPAESYQECGVPKAELQRRIKDIMGIAQLSCTRGLGNPIAVIPLAYNLEYANFPKDFVFSLAAEFFEPSWCHFIITGEVGVFEYDIVGRRWNQVSRLGPGEFMSIADASHTLALAAVSSVSTKRVARIMLQALDENAAKEMTQVSDYRSQFRSQDSHISRSDTFLHSTIFIPTFVQRQGGPLQRPSISALTALEESKDNSHQKKHLLLPLRDRTGQRGRDAIPAEDALAVKNLGAATGAPPRLQTQQIVLTKPLAAQGRILDRGSILGALHLVKQHYSTNIQERSQAVCYTDAGVRPRPIRLGEIAARKAEMERTSFLQRALNARDPDERIPILRQHQYALPTKNWGNLDRHYI